MLPVDETPQNLPRKACRLCGVEKTYTLFPKRHDTFDKLDTRCKVCFNAMSREVKRILRTAPPKPADGLCQCCGKTPKKWHMDHNHDTKIFRGWLCDACNMSIGHLGDTVEGLMKAVEYLQRSESNEWQQSPLIGAMEEETTDE